MNHSITIEGYGYRLRPVSLADAEFIVQLRTSPHALGMIGDTDRSVERQRAWIETYLRREGDYYFLVETHACRPVGAIGVYDIAGSTGEVGRWVISPGVLAAWPSALLVYRVAFDMLGLHTLVFRVVSTNRQVLSYTRRLGAREVGTESDTCWIGGRCVKMVRFTLDQADWPQTRKRVEPLAEMAGERDLSSSAGRWIWPALRSNETSQRAAAPPRA